MLANWELEWDQINFNWMLPTISLLAGGRYFRYNSKLWHKMVIANSELLHDSPSLWRHGIQISAAQLRLKVFNQKLIMFTCWWWGQGKGWVVVVTGSQVINHHFLCIRELLQKLKILIGLYTVWFRDTPAWRERARITWNFASLGRKSLSLDVRLKDLQFILYS